MIGEHLKGHPRIGRGDVGVVVVKAEERGFDVAALAVIAIRVGPVADFVPRLGTVTRIDRISQFGADQTLPTGPDDAGQRHHFVGGFEGFVASQRRKSIVDLFPVGGRPQFIESDAYFGVG